jgi:hypothetical protein
MAIGTFGKQGEDEQTRRQRAAQNLLAGNIGAGMTNYPGGTPGTADKIVAFNQAGVPEGWDDGSTAPEPIDFTGIAEREGADTDYGLKGEFERKNLGLQSALTDLQKRQGIARQRATQDYMTGLGRSENLRGLAMQQLQQSMAGRGLSRSGINLKQSGLLGQQYDQQQSDMLQALTRLGADLTDEWAMAQRDYGKAYSDLVEGQREYDTEVRLQQEQADAQRILLENQEASRRQDIADLINSRPVVIYEGNWGTPFNYQQMGISGPLTDPNSASNPDNTYIRLDPTRSDADAYRMISMLFPGLNDGATTGAILGALRSASSRPISRSTPQQGLTVTQLRNLAANPYSWIEFGAI